MRRKPGKFFKLDIHRYIWKCKDILINRTSTRLTTSSHPRQSDSQGTIELKRIFIGGLLEVAAKWIYTCTELKKVFIKTEAMNLKGSWVGREHNRATREERKRKKCNYIIISKKWSNLLDTNRKCARHELYPWWKWWRRNGRIYWNIWCLNNVNRLRKKKIEK